MFGRRDFLIAAAASAAAAAAGPEPGRAAGSTVHDIEIRRFRFVPATVDVRAGDTIRWTNFDLAPHTATADDGRFDTGGLARGESGTVAVTEDLSRSYHCAFHPHMKARIDIVG